MTLISPKIPTLITSNMTRSTSMGAIIHNPDRSDREKWSTSKGGPVFSKLFQLDRTDPLSFGPKFPEILVEWIAPDSAECTGGPSVI